MQMKISLITLLLLSVTGSAHKHRNLKHVDYSIVNHNEACRHSHHTAHSRVNEPNDSVQLPVPELTDYFEDMSQLVRAPHTSKALIFVRKKCLNVNKWMLIHL